MSRRGFHVKGWITLMIQSSNPKTRQRGLAIKRQLEAEYEVDCLRLSQSPAFTRIDKKEMNG